MSSNFDWVTDGPGVKFSRPSFCFVPLPDRITTTPPKFYITPVTGLSVRKLAAKRKLTEAVAFVKAVSTPPRSTRLVLRVLLFPTGALLPSGPAQDFTRDPYSV